MFKVLNGYTEQERMWFEISSALATGGASGSRVTFSSKANSTGSNTSKTTTNSAKSEPVDNPPAKQASNTTRPSPRQSERDLAKELGTNARTQVSYKNGKEVPYGTPGSVRPDCVLGTCAFEVKNYDIGKNSSALIKNVSTQVKERNEHLPGNMKQQIVIDIRGQAVSEIQKNQIRSKIIERTNGAIKASDIRFQ